MNKKLIINADGYGFTDGISKACEECIAFGTVKSVSVNVNFPSVDRLRDLIIRYPHLSIGCHLNPVIGKPVSAIESIPTLVNKRGEFYYKEFKARWLKGYMSNDEMKTELLAQINKTKELAGARFTHIDFHMALHRLPRLYSIFLDVVKKSEIGRIRTHRYFFGIDEKNPKIAHLLHLCSNPANIAKYVYNNILRDKALSMGIVAPDNILVIVDLHWNNDKMSIDSFINLLRNIPEGISEFIVHPGYVDDELRRWSTLLEPRERMLEILLNPNFKNAIEEMNIELVGYDEIELGKQICC